MSEVVGVGFKLQKGDLELLKVKLEEVGLTQTKFFRACVEWFLRGDTEELLSLLGFEKKVLWEKRKKG